MSTPIGPYAPIVVAGGLLFTSGQLGVVPGPDGAPHLVDGGTGAQAARALLNAEALLAGAGATKNDVIKATVFLTDMADFVALNEVWVAFFDGHRPARSAVGVAALPMGATVEIELIARTHA